MNLLRAMLREEWRLHTRLFGGRRFAAFPIVLFVLAGVGLTLLAELGVERGTVVGGLLAVVAFLGLQVGTIGLVGRDAIRAVLGETTLLVSSHRSLPLSFRRLLGTFVLKDLLYYTGLILAPLALADGLRALALETSPLDVGLLWVALAGAFALGATASLAAVALATRSKLGLLVGLGAVVAIVSTVDLDPIAFTAAGFYGTPTVGGALRAAAPILCFGTIAVALFEPIETSARSATTLRLPVGDGVAGRTLREVARSSGSVWKVLFSLSVFGGATGWLLVVVADAAGLTPAPGIAFGTLLGLGSFSTYAWVTQFDDPAEFDRYPLAQRRLFAGKLIAFLTLTVPSGVVVLAAAGLWYDPRPLVIGVVVLPAIATYVFGVSVVVAGLSPTALLFDVTRFTVFGALIAVVGVPMVVLALVAGEYPAVAPVLAVGLAVVAGGIGLGLWSSGLRWQPDRQ